jgi:formylglycine-generating enzyme required for sulfatase activity
MDPNELGLFDMSGNVEEWCHDWDGDYTSSVETNAIGPESGSHRVVRGGCWAGYAENCRVATRNSGNPTSAVGWIGFRIARTAF